MDKVARFSAIRRVPGAETLRELIAVTLTLDYAPPPASRVRWWPAFAAGIVLLAAVGILWNSTALAQQLIGWGSCGTGRQAVGQQLYFIMPATAAIPGGCWSYTGTTGLPALLSRMSFVTSLGVRAIRRVGLA
jgi:hypothetical protein